MKLPRRNFLHLAAGAAALPVVSRIAWAQAYPTRPVRIIVTFAAGGANDVHSRLFGQLLSERLGQPFIVENRPGGGGNLGAAEAIRSRPDGYTMFHVSISHAINASFYEKRTLASLTPREEHRTSPSHGPQNTYRRKSRGEPCWHGRLARFRTIAPFGDFARPVKHMRFPTQTR